MSERQKRLTRHGADAPSEVFIEVDFATFSES